MHIWERSVPVEWHQWRTDQVAATESQYHQRATHWSHYTNRWLRARVVGLTGWLNDRLVQLLTMITQLLNQHVWKSAQLIRLWPVLHRLLHESEYQSENRRDGGSAPESPAPSFVPLLPDSVSDYIGRDHQSYMNSDFKKRMNCLMLA